MLLKKENLTFYVLFINVDLRSFTFSVGSQTTYQCMHLFHASKAGVNTDIRCESLLIKHVKSDIGNNWPEKTCGAKTA